MTLGEAVVGDQFLHHRVRAKAGHLAMIGTALTPVCGR